MTKPIRGAGGGGKGGGGEVRVPVESPDSLRSRAYAKVLDLVSEGEIEGLTNGLQSIYLDGTPIQNPDGSYNFQGLEVATRTGSQAQSYIPGFSTVENTIQVGVEAKAAVSVVRQLTNQNLDAVRVTIGIPQLSYQNPSNGDLGGTTVQYAIDVQSNGGGFVPQVLGQIWDGSGMVTVGTAWFRSTTNDTRGMQILCSPGFLITNENYRMEYRLVGSPTWLTAGVTFAYAGGNKMRDTLVFGISGGLAGGGQNSFITPQLNAGQWEARIVKISDGSAPPTSYEVDTSFGGTSTRPITYTPNRLYGSPFETITGKTTSRYQRSHLIRLTGSPPWDIRVRRITPDSTVVNLQNKTWWDTYTEIIDAKLRYPNSALVGIKIDASQFQTIPTRGYDMKLLRVRVPTNYNPTTRAYTGSWDGTFQVAWTDNPAWCFYDLLTNDRYGLGELIDASQVDKWAMYQIGRYCDELVPDGFGGTEPRFTCNLYLQTRQEAYKVLQDFASIFRGMVFWATGSVTAVQDAPADPVALFTPANVIEGKFAYSGSGLKARHTVALVTWNDPDDLYRQKVEYVEDRDGITRYGVQQTEVVAVGCTSRGQANRVGRWLLYSERAETETVQFSVGLDGAVVRPGHIIKVADANRAGARLGGRVRASTATTVTVDKAPTLDVTGWTLYATLPDGTVEQRTVTGRTGDVITVNTAFGTAPTAQGIWILSAPTVEAQTFRVITIAEDQGSNTYAITALKHEPLKYAAIEQGLALQPRDITLLQAVPPAPTDGALTEYLYTMLTDVKVGVTITWSQVDGVKGYVVRYRVDQGNWEQAECTTNSLQIADAKPGTYEIIVQSVSAIGMKSPIYRFVKPVLGKTAKPADLTGLQMTVQGGTGLLQWDLHPDLDVRIGGQIAVRYSEALDGARWNTALPAAEFQGGATSGVVALAAGTYLAKAVDSTGNYSENAVLIVTDAPNIQQFNAVASTTQDPNFPGTTAGLVVVNNRLQLDQATYWDTIADLDAYEPSLDSGLVESGEYEFDAYIDTGAVYTSRLQASFALAIFNVANLVDEWPLVDTLGLVDEGVLAADFVDTWEDWDLIVNFDTQSTTDDTTIQLFVSTTNDNPAASPVWSDWRLFYVADYTARAFRFKVRLNRGESPDNQVAVTRLGVTVDVPDRIESAENVSVPAGGLSVQFANAFFTTPAIAVTAENLATGDYAVISSKSSTGFTIQFRNSAGTGVARTMDWIAKGFGYQN